MSPWELLRVKKNSTLITQPLPNAILLLETEDEIYYLMTEQNDSITFSDLQRIIQELYLQINLQDANDGNVINWIRGFLLNKRKFEQTNIPSWIKEAKSWNQGWFPLILITRGKEWDEEALFPFVDSYLESDFLPIRVNPSLLLFLVSNEDLQFGQDHRKELDEFALGLHEMLQSEWNAEVKIGIDEPVTRIEDLLSAAGQLINDRDWVDCFWNEVTILTPWNHLVERLISRIPKTELSRLMGQQRSIDKDIDDTIQIFLEENLNMSETARRLYVHRNTLQYRIDKLKQQTGLDVKQFEDAMIYHIIARIHLCLKKSE